MFVTDDLLKEIRYVFVGFFDSDKNEQGEFLQKNRKKIKILVETITEQLVGNYFKHKYVNVPTALLTINNHLNQLSDYDHSLFVSLRDVLKDYTILADKTYIDHKPILEPFFLNEMRELCLNIALHKKVTMNSHAGELRRLLNER